MCYANVERERGESVRGSRKLETGSREEGFGVASPWEQLVQSVYVSDSPTERLGTCDRARQTHTRASHSFR